MMTTKKAPEELLEEYAAGSASPGVSLLVAAHLTHAPASRARVREYEQVGGALLHAERPAELSETALSRAMAMIDQPEDDEPPRQPARPARVEGGPIPAVVMAHLGTDFDSIPWKFQLPGVSAADLPGFEGEEVSLLRARPGARVPQHTHEGRELTLVLQGCLSDRGIDYRKGDVAVNDEDDDHHPQITGDETCYCLIVQQGNLRFTGRFSRVLNYLGE